MAISRLSEPISSGAYALNVVRSMFSTTEVDYYFPDMICKAMKINNDDNAGNQCKAIWRLTVGCVCEPRGEFDLGGR
jgi:hypothetical protein